MIYRTNTQDTSMNEIDENEYKVNISDYNMSLKDTIEHPISILVVDAYAELSDNCPAFENEIILEEGENMEIYGQPGYVGTFTDDSGIMLRIMEKDSNKVIKILEMFDEPYEIDLTDSAYEECAEKLKQEGIDASKYDYILAHN